MDSPRSPRRSGRRGASLQRLMTPALTAMHRFFVAAWPARSVRTAGVSAAACGWASLTGHSARDAVRAMAANGSENTRIAPRGRLNHVSRMGHLPNVPHMRERPMSYPRRILQWVPKRAGVYAAGVQPAVSCGAYPHTHDLPSGHADGCADRRAARHRPWTLARWTRQPCFIAVFESPLNARCRAHYAVVKAQRDAERAAKLAALRLVMQTRGQALAAHRRECRRVR